MASRAAFEAWYARTFPDESLSRWDTYPHRYKNHGAQQAWRAWKAQDKRHKPVLKAAKELTGNVYLQNLHLYIQTLQNELDKLEATHESE